MTQWPHAPVHKLSERGMYMVTSATYQKVHFFNTNERLGYLHNTLLFLTDKYSWRLQAWAVFPNHYHFIAEAPENPETLTALLSQLHVTTAKYVNLQDNMPNRKVWWQYWDSRITYFHSLMARLNYVNQNPVRHGVVDLATNYSWCSASWFEQNTPLSFSKTVASFKTDKVKVIDDF